MKERRSQIPFAVERIDHVVLRVADLETSERFYSSVLGCEAVKRRNDLGLVHLRVGASMIDLISVNGKLGTEGGAGAGPHARNMDHLCLRIEPFNEQELIGHLRNFGLAPRGPASLNFGAEGEGLSLYFQDPDGNTIEFKGPSGLSQGGA